MKSLYFKNFISTAALVLVSFTIIGSAFVFLGRSYVIASHRENMEKSAMEVVRTASAKVRNGDLSDLDLRSTISSLAHSSGNHIFLTDYAGVIVSCSDMDVSCNHLGKCISASTIASINTLGLMDSVTDLGAFYENKQ